MSPFVLACVILTQVISPNGVTNAASYAPGFVSPGLIISIFGQQLGPAKLVPLQLDKTGKVSTSLGGVVVKIDGLPAPLLYVYASQIGAIVPYGISSASPRISVIYNGVQSPSVSTTLAQAAPGIFSLDSSGLGQAAAFNQDGSLNGMLNPASKGAIVSLYATGEGHTSPGGTDGLVVQAPGPKPVLAVNATVGGIPAMILYGGAAPTQVSGLFQVNLRVPTEAPSGSAVPVVITLGNKSSAKGVTIAVQ